LYGKRESKYDFLNTNTLDKIDFTELNPISPYYFFVPKEHLNEDVYRNWIGLNELLSINSTGIQTGNDNLLMAKSNDELINKIKSEFNFSINKQNIAKVSYRPFDDRVYFFLKSRTKNPTPIKIPLSYRSRYEVMKNFKYDNIGLVISRQWRNSDINSNYSNVFIVNQQAELALFLSANAGANIFPLFSYPDDNAQLIGGRIHNLNYAIITKIESELGLPFINENTRGIDGFSAMDLFDYIYAILHSPTYREKFKEFLKIDFPRIPIPKDSEIFWKLVNLGSQIRQIHLLQSPTTEQYITQYLIDGNNIVTKPRYQDDKVYINDSQYFNNVPNVAWNFYIGGYQPAQKWLKDRKDSTLDFEDILHYQKIIIALVETDRLMKEVDKIDFIN
jgi:predicted helicase